MKRSLAFFLLLSLFISLYGCRKQDAFAIEFTIPAGSGAEYVFADEEISPNKNRLRLRAGAGYGEAVFILKPVETKKENACDVSVTLMQGKTVTVDVEKDAWFRIGILKANPNGAAAAASVYVEDVTLRIE
ncbi:MAG: hypothetical protein E7330_04930 [Clostridiales bacterium]|nr:hypothetical protein [Clostridiales bacterium]